MRYEAVGVSSGAVAAKHVAVEPHGREAQRLLATVITDSCDSTHEQLGFASDALNRLRKIHRIVLVFLKLMIAVRVAGRLRGAWQ